MGKQAEGSLQERIQRFIEAKNGYVKKNWGSMISRKGVADLTACYKGLYITIEVKDDKNIPSAAQGVHCRKVKKAGGISVVVWTLDEVKILLEIIDSAIKYNSSINDLINTIYDKMKGMCIDDGSKY